MVICGSYVFEFSVNKDMKIVYIYNKGGGNMESSGIFISNTNYQRIEN